MFSDTGSESVLSCLSNSYYIVSVWWQYLVGAWQFSDGESVYGISRKAKVMPYQFEPELSPHGNSSVNVALSALHATTTNRCWELVSRGQTSFLAQALLLAVYCKR